MSAYNTYMNDGINNLLSAMEENRDNYTMAATVGAAAGLALTVLDERSNLLTGLVTAAIGTGYVAAIHTNRELHLIQSSTANMAIVGGIGLGYTALVGAVANRLAGDKPDASEL